MADDTVRGCVWGAARHLHPYPAPIPDGLYEAIERTCQALSRDGRVPLLSDRDGIDCVALAAVHEIGYAGEQMQLESAPR